MRIAMVSEHASPLAALGGVDAGGQNVFVEALARELGRLGNEVVVHTRRDDPSLPERVTICEGVEVHHVDAGPPRAVPKDELLRHMGAFGDELERCWRRRRPDVVHAHFWMSGHASLAAAAPLRLPVVQTFHALGTVKKRYQGGMDTSPERRLAIEQEIARRAARVLPTCSDEVFELMRMGANAERLTVVPCGVDLERFTPDGPVAPRGRRKRLLYVGRLVQRKGVGNIVSALPQLPGVELLIAGGPDAAHLDEDPEASRLAALAELRGVADRVHLLGRVGRDELPALFRSADAVVSVPWYEPFGITPLEAMACGVPVIASAVGGMIDSVVDGRTGVHVPPRDPDRLAEATRQLLADPRRRREYGAAGARRARRLYDWRRVASQVLAVYEEVSPARAGAAAAEPLDGGQAHLTALEEALRTMRAERERLDAWGGWLAERLLGGARLLAVGNGGSAAEAQHLTAELVGRFGTERRPLSAIPLHGDGSAVTAIANDYGAEEVFARQVEAHARPGDVLVALSTSGSSENVVRAVVAANRLEVTTLALTGPAPNPLAELADEALVVAADSAATVQEVHLVAVHLLCGAVDRGVARLERRRGTSRDAGALEATGRRGALRQVTA